MGESNFVFASDDNVRAQGLLSSLIRSMVLQGKYAIVRQIRRNGSDPRIGILAPQPYDKDNGYNYEALFYCDAPFRQDYTRNNMQPLNRVVSISGEESTEHTSLPTKEMLKAVDQLIDAQDLTDADEDEDGEPMPWFRTVESYNPAIHNTRDALARRVFLPQDRTLPAPHAEVAKFLQTPEKVLKRSAASMEHCQGLFDLNYGAMNGKEQRCSAVICDLSLSLFFLVSHLQPLPVFCGAVAKDAKDRRKVLPAMQDLKRSI